MASDDAPMLFNLFSSDPTYRADPDKRLKALREGCPVKRDAIANVVMISRYADVRATVNDRTLVKHPVHARPDSLYGQARMRPDGRPLEQDTTADSILHLDDPDHARIRGPLMQAFYKRAAKMRPATERIVGEVLDGLAGRKSFDMIADVGVPIPILVIADVLGVERGRLKEFREWSEAIILTLNPFATPEQRERVAWAGEMLDAFFMEEMAARRMAPRDDLLTDMVQLQAEGAALSDREIVINCSALLVGGNLTTTDLIGNGVKLLLEHPEQLAALKADPSLINAAVEEILRFDGPIDFTIRVAPREMELDGCPVHKGDPIWTMLRAANKDPAVFEEPDRFDIMRKHAPHVAFGGGAHICIGAPLARMEAQCAIPAIFDRFPNLRLAKQEFVWRALPGFRGLERLIVEP
ncbi:MAG: cytochrome P450 [Hydrogenophilaceae bacterium]|jgi:hypothetical protein|nr:cytochrome P450 [Hydrogenophilaceae bacterium]